MESVEALRNSFEMKLLSRQIGGSIAMQLV